MERRRIRIRVKKPSIVSVFLFILILFMSAMLIFDFVRITGLERELAAVRWELQRVHTAANDASAPQESNRILSGPEILVQTPVIGHAMGAVNLEGSYYNSLEAFQASYAAGIRVFEVDLTLTRDGKAALTHDWGSWQRSLGKDGDLSIPTLEEFLATPVHEGHTPLSFRSVLNLMTQYPDICIVTDTKYANQENVIFQFTSMLADAEDMGLTHLFDRIIIQLYNRNMRQYLDTLYPFPHFIYTLYLENQPDSSSFQELAAYCAETGVMGITMPIQWWDDSFASVAKEYGVKVYVHTENDIDAARDFLKRGVSGIYTDYLTPDSLMGN